MNKGSGVPIIGVPHLAGAAMVATGPSAPPLASSARLGEARRRRLQQARTRRGFGLMAVSLAKEASKYREG